MNNLLRARERETYAETWQTVDHYGAMSPGATHVPLFLDMARVVADQTAGRTVLDAGCGSGKGGLALQAHGFEVRLCDITDAGLDDAARALPFDQACLWDDLGSALGFRLGGKFDYVYCCDVLEHLPLPFTMLVVARLLAIARKGVFLSIALHKDINGYWVGKPLHQSVQGFVEWRDQVSAVGCVQECRDLLHTGLYYVTPRSC